MDTTSITVDLGLEELLFSLKALGIQTLPGLGESPLLGLTDDQVKRLLSAGFNSLRARGFVEQSATAEAGLAVDRVLASLIAVCASAQQLLLVRRQGDSIAPEVHYLHMGKHLTVIHSTEAPGVHRLLGTVDAKTASAVIHKALRLNGQLCPAVPPVHVRAETLEGLAAHLRARDAASAVAFLLNQGVGEAEARRVVEELSTMTATCLVSHIQVRPEAHEKRAVAQSYTVVETPTCFWIAEPHGAEKDPMDVELRPVSGHDLISQIDRMIVTMAELR